MPEAISSFAGDCFVVAEFTLSTVEVLLLAMT
jgi:hypothetical protein